MKCDRCGKEMNAHGMSYFNTNECCLAGEEADDCTAEEHPPPKEDDGYSSTPRRIHPAHYQ